MNVLFVIDKDGYNGTVETVLYDGKCPYSHKTAADFEAEGFTLLTYDEFAELDRKYEQSLCGDWKEITEEQFEEGLNVLPPIKWMNGGFYIGEPTRGSLYGFYQRWQGKYYESLQSVYTDREQIIDSLMKWISEQEV